MKTPSAQPRRHPMAMRIARLVSCCVAALALWACGPVYIPVPPPGQISFTSEALVDATGAARTYWIARGGPNGNAGSATFYVLDLEHDAGVIAPAAPDGSFVSGPLEGSLGDRISISYRDTAGRDSPSACRLLSDLPVAEPCP